MRPPPSTTTPLTPTSSAGPRVRITLRSSPISKPVKCCSLPSAPTWIPLTFEISVSAFAAEARSVSASASAGLNMGRRLALFATRGTSRPRTQMLQTTSMQPPTIEDIRAAAQRIDGAVVRTPMLVSRTLSEVIGAEVWLKFENLQFTAAYKERGALNKLLQLTPEERARGVIAASAGNHAQAVAYHAKRLGIPATIVMPESTPTMKVTQTEGHGAHVLLHGDMFDDAHSKARELTLEQGYVFVHPFDDPMIIAGAGTVALEMLEDAPDLDTIVVPIGGGGLMSGIAIAARALKPDVELIGVEAELYPSMKCA